MIRSVSKGSLALSQCGRTHKSVALAVKSTEASVSYWARGERSPGAAYRSELFEILGIPVESWDEMVESKPQASKANVRPGLVFNGPTPTLGVIESEASVAAPVKPRIPYGPGSTIEFARQLYEEQQTLHEQLTQDDKLPALEKLKIYKTLGGNLKNLGDMTGEFLPSEAKILAMPQWRTIEAAVVKACVPYPDAMAAIVKALEELNKPPVTH